MKDVLVALADLTRNTEERIDTELALPVAESLADYMPDVYGIVPPGYIDYIRAFGDTKPPWEDEEGVHMAVPSLSLLHVMRHLADTPAAYAELRDAASEYAVVEFAEVPHGAEEWRFESPVRDVAYVLGAMDAIADDVRQDGEKGDWSEWSADAYGRMTKDMSAPPAFSKDPAGHISASWRQTLRAGGRKAMTSSFEAQSTDMVRVWGESADLDGR